MNGEQYLAWVRYLVLYTSLNSVEATNLVERMRAAGKTSQKDFEELERQVMIGGYDFALRYIGSFEQ